jgi:cytochrome c
MPRMPRWARRCSSSARPVIRSAKGSGITWDEATLKDYLENPRAKIPGTKMIFPGVPKDEDIDNVIAYLKQFGADGKKS